MVRRARSFSAYTSCILHCSHSFSPLDSRDDGRLVFGRNHLKMGFAFVRLCVCAFALFELRGADLGGRLSRADWRIWAGGEGGE